MKLEYDPQADAAYLRLADAEVDSSEEVRPGIVVDYDARHRVIGIEVLHVKRQLPEADTERIETEVA